MPLIYRPLSLSLAIHLGALGLVALFAHQNSSSRLFKPLLIELVKAPHTLKSRVPRSAPPPVRKTLVQRSDRLHERKHANPPLADAKAAPSPPSQMPALETVSNSLQPDAASATSGNSVEALSYRDELQAALEAEKEYPALARARGQQGRVEVGFLVTKQGEIRDAQVLKPSPFAILDQAAVATVRHLGHFKPVPDQLSLGDWRVSVFMDFRLNR